jgi:hypothetical protein
MAPTKKQLIGGIAAGLALGGIVYVATRKASGKQAEEEDAFKPSTVVPAPEQPKQAAKVDAPTIAEVSPATATSSQFTREYSFRVNEDNEKMLEEALQEQATAQAKARPVAVLNNADGRTSFAHLGVSLKPPAGWLVREEPSPMPNVAMITVTKPEFAEKQANPEDMGSVPIILLSVEDISAENLDLFEFKEKSKQMALSQMMMMTNGMVQPQMKFDDSLTVGPFLHCLEYAQSLPPYFELSVCNLLAVQGGLAFVFQIMCSPSVMGQYKSTFMDIARTFQLIPGGDAAVGTLVLSAGRVATVNVVPSWSWTVPSSNTLLEFQTPSSTKSEQISLYDAENTPAFTLQDQKTVDGVVIGKWMEGRNESKVFKFGKVVAVVKPLMKPRVQINEANVISMVKSAKIRDSAAAEDSCTYINPDHGYKFATAKGGRVVASRVGGGTVVYAPLGIPNDPTKPVEAEETGPTVTIRVGDPDTDPDCAENLDAWEERMEAEKASGHITGVQRVTISGKSCLTFTSKDMQEIGPGQRLEVVGKVFIFVHGRKTTLIRWETPTGLWRKFEPKMNRFIDSFNFL